MRGQALCLSGWRNAGMVAEFVDLASDRTALGEMLVQMGLVRPGEVFVPEPLTGGVSSNIFRLDLPCGPVCVKQALPQLKVQKEWRAPVSRVLAEMDWLQAVHAIAPDHVPRILAVDRVRGAFVMEYLAGTLNWKSELLDGRIDLEAAGQVTDVLARVHSATARSPQVERRFAHDATFYAIRLEPYLVETARVHPDLARELIALVAATQSTRLALVHGDVSPKNILLAPKGPLLLDAECACYGDPAFDLAFLLNHALLKAARRPGQAAAFEALFRTIAQRYLEQVDWEPAAEFDGRCARLLPGLLLARVDGKSPVEYLDESARDWLRPLARSLLSRPPQDLADLLQRWRAGVAAIARAAS